MMLCLWTLATILPCAGGGESGAVAPGDPPLAPPVYLTQALSVAPPSALEFWVQSPKRHTDYPWNIIRLWFPEAAGFRAEDGTEPWQFHMNADPARWRSTDSGIEAAIDVPGGGRFLRSVRVEGAVAHLEMTFENRGGEPWIGAHAGSCLQLSAAPDYEDNLGERTYWVLDGELTLTRELAITDAGMRGSCSVGQTAPLKSGKEKVVSEGAVFVASRDGRYVLGYSWQPAAGLFYNRAGIVACNHVQPGGLDVAPSERRTVRGVLFIHEGTPAEAYRRYVEWKSGLSESPAPAILLSPSFLDDCALVCVDIQPGERTTATLESLPESWREDGMDPEDLNAASDHKFDVAYPNARRVVDLCRALGLPLVFVHWGFTHPDGMDLAPDIRSFYVATYGPDVSGWPNGPGDPGARPAPFLGVRDADYVIAKTDHDAFVSSNIDHVLRNLGAKRIIFIGGHTDACLGKTAVAAKERGYETLCVSDATFSGLRSLWERGLTSARFDHMVTTSELEALARAKDKAAVLK